MSSVFGKLFGGETKALTAPSAFQQLPGFAQGAFQEQFQRARGLSQQPELFAPTPLAPQTLQALAGLGQPLSPLTGEQFQQTLGIFQNPFEQQVVQNAIRDIQEQGQGFRSDIGEQASAAGGFGGTRQALLESELNRNLLRSIGDVSGNLRQRGFETAAERASRRIGREEDLRRQRALDLLGAGGIVQQQATAERQAPLEALRFLQSQIGALPTSGGETTFREKPGLLSQLAEGASSLKQIGKTIGGFGTFFSDLRLKKDIKHVGNKNGFNIYEFKYKGQSPIFRGVIAQEIEEIMPKAVSQHESGFKMVNYNILGIQFVRI